MAIIPLLPAAYSLVTFLVAGLMALLTLVGLLRYREHRQVAARFLWRQLPSLLVIGVGCVAIYGGVRLIASALTPTATFETDGTWPMHRGNPQRTGSLVPADEESTANSPGGIVWQSAREASFLASPAVVGDEVLCIGNRGDRGYLYRWKASDGTLLSRDQPEHLRATFSSPVVTEEYIVFGEGLHHTQQARVVCLERRTGDVAWTFTTDSHVECTPWIDGNEVFVASGDDGVYALSLSAADPSDRVLWHASGNEFPDAETCLAVDESTVYVGLGDGGEAIAFLDRGTGTERKRLPMPYPVHAPPAIDGDRIYFAMGSGDYINRPADGAGQVVCVDRRTHEVLWEFATDSVILGAIVAEGGEVIFGTANGTLSVLNAGGEQVSSWQAPGPLLSGPAVSATHIVICDDTGRLSVLDRHSLVPVAQMQLGDSGRFVSSPVIAHGRVYVGTERHGFVCVRPDAFPPDQPGPSQ